MAEEDTKNKEQETPGSDVRESMSFGALNPEEDDFLKDRMPTGIGSAESIMADITSDAYKPDSIGTKTEFIGIVLRVIPKPYSFTQKLGPYYKILAFEAKKKGVEFVNNVLNQLTLVQVRVPELDSMIPDPPIYDVNLQLSNKPKDQLTDVEKRSITLIERHGTFVGWSAEGNTPPTVGSYVRVAYNNPRNRTGGRYLGTVVSSDGVVPSMGMMGSQAFADCMGNLGSAPASPPKVSNPTPPPVTPTESAASGSAASASATPPPPIKTVAPTPSPMESCVHLLGGQPSPGSVIPGSNIYLPPQTIKPPTSDPGERIKEAAASIGIPEAVLLAIKEIESGGNKPEAVRFEPHVFLRDYHPEWRGTGKIPFTKGVRKSGEVVNWSLTRSETNRAALLHAFSHDPEAAIKSTSFGLFQVMGTAFFEGEFGYKTGQEALSAFDSDPEGISYRLLKHWFAGSSKALAAAKALDWAELARRYNGPGQVDKYAPKLHKAYEKYTT